MSFHNLNFCPPISEWNWHCSKCWREHLRKTGSVATIPPASSGRSHDRSTAAPSMSKSPSGSILRTASVASATLPSPKKSFLSSQSSFSKFEDKKKRQTLDKNFKQIFQGRSFGGGSGKESPEKHSVRKKLKVYSLREARKIYSEHHPMDLR